jgi:hypothetical protein
MARGTVVDGGRNNGAVKYNVHIVDRKLLAGVFLCVYL